MNGAINFFSQILPALQALFILSALIAGTLAGIYVFRGTKQSGIVSIQSGTIVAQQQQLDALKEQNLQQQKKIDHLEFEMKAVRDALKDEGILITVDGERVTIKDTREPNTTRHIIRKPAKKPTPPLTVVKKPDE